MSGLLYIAEIDTLGIDANGNMIPAGVRPLLVPGYSIAVGASPTNSKEFSAQTRFVELHSDVDCWFEIQVNPDPVTAGEHMTAGERNFYPLRPGVRGLKVGVRGA